MYEFLWLKTEQWEIIYYVAFVLLTLGIAFFSGKTYFFQAKKVSELFCKCVDKSTASGNSNLYIEIYNFGNIVSKNINVRIQGVEFGIIPFLKPTESYVIPFAYFIHFNDNKMIQSNMVEIEKDCKIINVELNINGDILKYDVDISIQQCSTKLSETDTKSIVRIADELKGLERAQEKTTTEVKKISEAISKLKIGR